MMERGTPTQTNETVNQLHLNEQPENGSEQSTNHDESLY